MPEQVFVSAILADMGMVILNRILGDEYRLLVEGVDDEELAGKEQIELGISHVEIGMRLATKWRFPSDLVEAIALHHKPVTASGLHREAALTYASRRAIAGLAEGFCFADILAALPQTIGAFLAMSAEDMAALWEKSCRDLEEAKAALAR